MLADASTQEKEGSQHWLSHWYGQSQTRGRVANPPAITNSPSLVFPRPETVERWGVSDLLRPPWLSIFTTKKGRMKGPVLPGVTTHSDVRPLYSAFHRSLSDKANARTANPV